MNQTERAKPKPELSKAARDMLAHLGLGRATILGRFAASRNGVYAIRDGTSAYVIKLFMFDDRHESETAAIELMGGDPLVPKVLHSGRLPNGPRYLVMPYVAGTRLSQFILEESADIPRWMHAAARRIGSIEAAGQGAGLERFPLSPFAQWLQSGATLAARTACLCKHLGDDFPARLDALASPILADLRAADQLVFAHGDYQPKNILVRRGEGIEAILDWELAVRATQWEEAGLLLRYALDDASEAAIIAGHEETGPRPHDWIMRCRISNLVATSLNLAEGLARGQRFNRRVQLIRGLLQLCEGGSPDLARSAARALLEI